MTKRQERRIESVVAVAKSASAKYDKVDFKGMLVRVIEHLKRAGIPFPHSGTVFLKPNVVIGAGASEGITTDPHFISALIGLLKMLSFCLILIKNIIRKKIFLTFTIEKV